MRLNKFFLLALAVVLAFASCSKDDNTTPGVNPNAPLTSVALKIDLAKPLQGAPATYVTEAGTTVENTLNAIDVYVFAGAELEEIVLGATMTNNVTHNFTVTAGAKRVYVLANKPIALDLTGIVKRDVATSVVGTDRVVFEKKLQQAMTVAQATDAVGGFLMTNIKGSISTINLEPGITNPVTQDKNIVTVQIGRITAKVRPMFTATATTSPAGELSTVNFRLGTVAKHTYLIGQFNAIGDIITPYYDGLSGTVAPTVIPPTTVAESLYSDYTDFGGAYQLMNTSDLPASTAVSYAFENSNVTGRMGNSTRVVIRGVFTPKKMIDNNGDDDLTAIVTGDDFYVLSNTAGPLGFCKTDGAGGTLAGTAGFKSAKYTGGLSYYHVYLTVPSTTAGALPYTVVRNNLSKVNITGVSGPGMNSELGLIDNGVSPIDADTDLVVKIDVLEWTVVDQNVIIG